MDIGIFILGIIAGIIIAVVAGIILLPIQRLWPSKGEIIAEESLNRQLKLDKKQEKEDKQNILKAIERIERTLAVRCKVVLSNVGNELSVWQKGWRPHIPELIKSATEEIIADYPNHNIQVRLRDAIEPFFYDHPNDLSLEKYSKRCQEVSENFDRLREEAEAS